MIIDIKKIFKKRSVSHLIDGLVKLSGRAVYIKNDEDEVLYGKSNDPAAEYRQVQVSNEVRYQLFAGEKTDIIMPIVTSIINSEIEKIKLAAETLYGYQEINMFYNLSEKVAVSVDLKEISDYILEEARKIIKCTSAAMLHFSENNAVLKCVSKYGTDHAWQAMFSYYKAYGKKIFGNSEIINNASADDRFGETRCNIKSIIYAPLNFIDTPLGIISLANSANTVYDAGDLKLLRALALQASSVIKNAQLFADMHDSFTETVHALIETVEKMEQGNEGHSRRVSECCIKIGKHLGMQPKDLILLKITALLHDIGKIRTTEFNYRDHPVNSVKLIERIKYLRSILPGIKHHHENFNGTGFPDGLKGEAIPLNARIIAVADAFEHLSAEYGLNINRSLKDILANSNILYDPDIVMALLKAYGKVMEAVQH